MAQRPKRYSGVLHFHEAASDHGRVEFLEEIPQPKSNFSLGSLRIHNLSTRKKLKKHHLT